MLYEQKFKCILPPTSNTAYANKANGGRVKTEAVKKWRKDACFFIPRAEIRCMDKLFVMYSFTFSTAHRRDVANYEKILTDFLVSRGYMEDDSQIIAMFLEKGVDRSVEMGGVVHGYITNDLTRLEGLKRQIIK